MQALWAKSWAFLLGLFSSEASGEAAPATLPSRTHSEPQRAAPLARAAVSPSKVFTPTRPRAGRRALMGRLEELSRILEAICDDGAHVVLYAERGRGKTSLSNLSIEGLRRRGAIVARYACEASTTFDSMMHGLAADLPSSLLSAPPGSAHSDGCDGLLPDRPLCPADIAALPQGLSCPMVVFVIDEFDRVEDVASRTRLADTIKLVSDRNIRVYFMIVGVSATLEDILGQHISIQRNIAAIHLPLLEDQEVASMIEKGGEQAGIRFSPDAVALVVGVARGMPYMAQLLGLRIAQAALQRRHDVVQSDDLVSAVQRLIGETASGVISSYRTLTSDGRNEEMVTALLRTAEAEHDRWGRIRVEADETGGGVTIGGKRVSHTVWMQLRNATMLVPTGSEPDLMHFADRAMIYYVELLATRTRLIGEDYTAPGTGPTGQPFATEA